MLSIFEYFSKMKLAIFICLLYSNFFFSQEDSSFYADAPLSFPITIYYQNNSAEISHVSRLRLSVLAEYLQENKDRRIIIEGHVCCGPAQRVSKRRARSVYKYLIKLKVPREQMKYVGKSFDEPKVKKEKSEADKDLNRRVEIRLL